MTVYRARVATPRLRSGSIWGGGLPAASAGFVLRIALWLATCACLPGAHARTHARSVAPHGPAAPAASAASAAPTWAGQVAPILYANCTSCHHPGGAGPFSLVTYQDAQRWGTQVAAVTQSRYMPPWLPEHQGGAFADERRLSTDEVAEIARWVKASMPSGDLAQAPRSPAYSKDWQNGPPDLVLQVAEPFTMPASGTDVFRNFVLPYPLKESHYIRALEIRPGAQEIVHHANILVDPTGSFRRQHAADWRAGVPGMEVEVDAGNAFDPDGHFLFWKPDSPVLSEPEGMQWKIDPGTDLILNMHLKPSGKAETLSAEVGLYFTDKPPTHQPMLLQLEHDRALDIPPGIQAFPVDDTLRLPVAVTLLGIYPHAHYLARRMEAWAVLPDQQRMSLITIPDWDIDRQSVYGYRAPLLLPAGTVVHMHYLYDNSDANVHNPHRPPVRVRAGNRSVDEMAHLWLQVLPVEPVAGGRDARLLLQEAWMRSRITKEPGDAIAEYDLAAALEGEGRYAEAATIYRGLLVARPDDGRARNSLGATLESSGAWEQARSVYEQVIAEDASGKAGCDARFNLARLGLRHDQPAAAETAFRAMLGQCPEEAAVHSGLGAAMLGEGHAAEAQPEFARALTLDPDDFTALYNLGALALATGQREQAVSLLERATRQQPGDPDAHQQLAGAYAEAGRLADAIAELRQLVALTPAAAGAHAALSQALAASGQVAPAIAEQKQALALDAADADGWNNLGALEARLGSREAARADFEHALTLAPDHAQARANLARLAAR